jgi:hypothetical protein
LGYFKVVKLKELPTEISQIKKTERYTMRKLNALIWLGTITTGGLLWTRYKTFGVHKRRPFFDRVYD